MVKQEHYNGSELLLQKDINNQNPEVIVATGNRISGKSYFFKEYMLNGALKENHNFMMFSRKKTEVDAVCESFFADICQDYKVSDTFTYQKFNGGLYTQLYFNNKKVGYCTYINGADAIKRISPMFYDVDRMYFDEMISESGEYLENEVTKIISIHTSIARGGKSGKKVRYVPFIFVGNSCTALNPYFSALGVDVRKIHKDIKYYKGDGFVIGFDRNKYAAKELRESGFGRAFAKSSYLQGSIDNSMYLDTNEFILKNIPSGSKYILSIVGKERFIGVYQTRDKLLVFSDKFQANFKIRCTLDNGYQTPGVPHITATPFYPVVRNMVLNGQTFFSDIEIRKNVLDAIGRSLV